jgi:hypothetical protein
MRLSFFAITAALVVSGSSSSKVFFEEGPMKAFYVQLTLLPDAKRADMEFILNSECGSKHKFEYPKLFTVKGMDYTFEEGTKVFSFLNNPSEIHLKEIEEMNVFFASFGSNMTVPFEANLENEGTSIYARILRLDASLSLVDKKTDMPKLMKELEDKKTNKLSPAKGNVEGSPAVKESEERSESPPPTIAASANGADLGKSVMTMLKVFLLTVFISLLF